MFLHFMLLLPLFIPQDVDAVKTITQQKVSTSISLKQNSHLRVLENAHNLGLNYS